MGGDELEVDRIHVLVAYSQYSRVGFQRIPLTCMKPASRLTSSTHTSPSPSFVTRQSPAAFKFAVTRTIKPPAPPQDCILPLPLQPPSPSHPSQLASIDSAPASFASSFLTAATKRRPPAHNHSVCVVWHASVRVQCGSPPGSLYERMYMEMSIWMVVGLGLELGNMQFLVTIRCR